MPKTVYVCTASSGYFNNARRGPSWCFDTGRLAD